MHESQENLNRKRGQRTAQARERTSSLNESIQNRLRDNPEQRDIFQGSALNVALEEINDPRVYVKALQAAKVKIGGEKIRIIPFRYNAAALTVGLHQLATGTFPPALSTPEFEADREALKALDQQITEQVDDDEEPDPATVQKLLAAIYGAEEKRPRFCPQTACNASRPTSSSRLCTDLVVMLKAPSLDPVLAGVEKRPNATPGRASELHVGVQSPFRSRDEPATAGSLPRAPFSARSAA